MPKKEVLWEMDGHTAGKHLVLRAYLDRWFGILSNRFTNLLFVDGFCGPGEYSSGENGSPMIGLLSVIEHSHKALESVKIKYVFSELDHERLEHLKKKVGHLAIPKNIQVQFINKSFDSAIHEDIIPMVSSLDGNPCFVMADPFGVDQIPYTCFAELMKYPRVELYISFMYEFINRFKNQPQFVEPLNSLYGCTDWQALINTEDKDERKRLLYKLYRERLKGSGADHVIHFDLYNGNRLKYGIFFATKSILGSHKIKEAIWKVIPKGDFEFRSETSTQLSIDYNSPNFKPLVEAIVTTFRGKGWTSVKQILDFVASDKTEYYPAQVRKHGLKPIESSQMYNLEVRRTNGKQRRASTFPDDCEIMIE